MPTTLGQEVPRDRPEKQSSETGLRFELWGPREKQVIVLINSIGMTYEVWDGVVASLEGEFRFLRYNQRGHPGSSVPPGPYSLEDLGRDLIGLLDDLGIEHATLCGLSLGGLVAMWVAATHPDRVARLIVACTTAGPTDPAKWKARRELALNGGLSEIAAQATARWFTAGFIASNQARVSKFVQIFEECPPEGYASCCAVLEVADLRAELALIASPTTVVVGWEDQSFPLSDSVAIMSSVADGIIHILPRAAHLAPVEKPAEFARLIRMAFVDNAAS